MAIELAMSMSTASRRLPTGWDYLVLIQGTDGFNAVFDGRGEPKAAILSAVYGKAFQERLKNVALTLADTLYVEVIGYQSTAGLRDLTDLRLRHEGPAVLALQATYDEGFILRELARLEAATA